VRCQAAEGFEPPGEIIGRQKIREVLTQLLVAFVVVALHSCLLERPVHSLDLPIGPRMVWLGQPMFDAMMLTGPQEGVAAQHRGGAFAVLRQMGNWIPLSVKTTLIL